MAFRQNRRGALVYLTSDVLAVPHAFSTRLGGVSPAPWDTLNLRSDRGDGHEALLENYRRFLALLGADIERAVLSHQVHKDTVRIVTEKDAGTGLIRSRNGACDALITNVPALPLVVFSADCGTVLLHDPVRGAVGAVHAGWRGCALGIAEKTVREMTRLYGTDPADLRAALGPCIGPCCFETDGDVPEAMTAALGADASAYWTVRGAKYHVDLSGLNRLWLLRAGVRAEHTEASGLCTRCRGDLFWSHRRDGDLRGVQGAAVMLKENE
ncbi:MAG: peptidoglycan editing factor PgeF [Oscillibacter sp.]|nr:peptidoglycan editing factor PgeF [Oscillibacter sp.]